MIIGHELETILKGFTVNVGGKEIPVQYEHGDRDALLKFIFFKNKNNSRKYPLVFYVTSKVQDNDVKNKTFRKSDTQLVILMNTDEESLTKTRYQKTFVTYIEPVYKALIKKIQRSKKVLIVRKDNGFEYEDKANFGITEKGLVQKSNDDLEVTDFVDGRVIYVNIHLKK